MEKWFEDFLAGLPNERVEKCMELYHFGMKKVPNPEFKISYNMPAFFYKGKPVFYFSNSKKHIGFYPTASPIVEFEEELVGLKHSKGAVQLPPEKELPFDLLEKMIHFRLDQIDEA